MHELILDLVHHTPPHTLARLPLDDGALIACFDAATCPAPATAPRWLAKTAQGPSACLRLRAEAHALGYLERWAHALHIPRLLGWHEADPQSPVAPRIPAQACLIQTGLPGQPAPVQCNPDRPWAPLPQVFITACNWLANFQQRVCPPRLCSLPDHVAQSRLHLQHCLARHPDAGPLLLPWLRALDFAPLPRLPGVATHGDFWSGNILFAPSLRRARQLTGVIDWSGFGTGTALDDLFTWLATWRAPGSVSRMRVWLAVFFSPGQWRDHLRTWASNHGFDDTSARAAFLVFLANRATWELGMGLQARSLSERTQARHEWTELLAWMAQLRFPDPFMPFPR